MANEQNLREFMKNPREYLRQPMPRAPCKLAVLGVSYSGKTSLTTQLAKKYNAKVLDMKVLIQGKMKEAKDEMLEKVKEETTEATKELVRIKVKEQIEIEKSNSFFS